MTVLVSGPRREFGSVTWLVLAVGFSVLEGALVATKPLLALPVLAVLLVLISCELPLASLLLVTLALRAMTDDSSGTASRAAGSVNISGAVGAVFILLAVGLLLRARHGLRAIAGTTVFLSIWTLLTVIHLGTSFAVWREGIRELSVLAVAVIVIEMPKRISLRRAGRLVQVAAAIPALVVYFQLAVNHGQQVHANLRPNGTFSQPNSAAVFFAIAALISTWLFLECGRNRLDLLAAAAFGAATIGTYSIGGVSTLLVMLLMLGTARRGAGSTRIAIWGLAFIAGLAFVLTPLGASRLGVESNLSGAPGQSNSLTWRFANWESLLHQWESSPVIGQGLGATIIRDTTNGALPHNEYVRYLVETGAVGFVIILFAAGVLLRRLWRARRRFPRQTAFAIALVVGILFNCLGANTITYTPAVYIGALLLAAAIREIAEGHEPASATP